MKGLTKAMVIGVLAMAFLSNSTQKIKPAGMELYCWVFFSMENSDRHCYSNVHEESWPHSVPWGNWGVDSNVGYRYDDHQFQGWKDTGKWLEWNSNNEGIYAPPSGCGIWHNDKEDEWGMCWEQHTNTYPDPEENRYGSGFRKIKIPWFHWDSG